MIRLVVNKNPVNVGLRKGIVMKTVIVKLVSDVEQKIVQVVSHQTIIVATNQQVHINFASINLMNFCYVHDGRTCMGLVF